jgi:hypothetical protein
MFWNDCTGEVTVAIVMTVIGEAVSFDFEAAAVAPVAELLPPHPPMAAANASAADR